MKKNIYKIRLFLAGIVGILSILAILGIFYPVKFMDLQFTALLQRVLTDFSVIALVSVIAVILITLLFGRFYCSVLCPVGSLQEFAALIFKRKSEPQKNLPYKYWVAALTFGALTGGSALFIRHIDPYTMFGSFFSFSILGIAFTIAVLALVFYKNRCFCTNICPVGAILGLISKISLNKIYIDKETCESCGLCEKSCPSGCINSKEKTVENVTCVKCLKCLEECKKGAIHYGIKKEKILFSPKRRDFLFATATLIVLSGAVKAGYEISKNLAKKVRDIILPPGAKNANSMMNKCLNCNLCINNCPNKILVKANDNFGAVHIDYSKGAQYCKFDCNECAKVCPSGAIKRITLKEKQNTRIAMAMIKEDICQNCNICVLACPTGAIEKIDNKTVLNGKKCIGCGKCKKSCPHNAIEIFAVNEQRIIS